MDKSQKLRAEHFRQMILKDDKWLSRAILAIYARQTPVEQDSAETLIYNKQGFSGVHAEFGTSLAKWLLEGRALTPKQAQAARRIMVHYTGQLVQVAEEKQNGNVSM